MAGAPKYRDTIEWEYLGDKERPRVAALMRPGRPEFGVVEMEYPVLRRIEIATGKVVRRKVITLRDVYGVQEVSDGRSGPEAL